MSTSFPNIGANASLSNDSFSLVAGGPTHRLQQRLRLISAGSSHVARRAVLAIVVTWVPLLVLSAALGLAIGDKVKIPFLYDFAAYARFLIATPLLILIEPFIERRVAEAVAHFRDAGLVPERNYADYESLLQRAKRLVDSTLAEVLLVGVTAISILVGSHEFPFDFSTWRSLVSGTAHTLTPAGWWYLVVGLGLFQFLIWRWVWRLCIWYWFLWRVSKLPLRLVPTHPDRSAGLGFVGETQRFFWGIALALSATMAGVLANQAVHAGIPLRTFQIAIAGYTVVVLLVFLAPLLMFTPRLVQAKIKSLHDYSALAVKHNQMFDAKWVQGDNPKADPLLGAPEISSMADLGTVYEVLNRMSRFPFAPADALVLALAAAAPLLPLVLTVMPLGEVLDLLSKVLV